MRLSFKDLFYALSAGILVIFMLSVAKDIFIPLSFSLLLAFILYPIVKWLNEKGLGNALSISLSFLSVMVVLLGVFTLFSAQIVNIADQYDNFLSKLKSTFSSALSLVEERFEFLSDKQLNKVFDGLTSFFSDSGLSFLSGTLDLTGTFLSYSAFVLVASFLILFYRKHFFNAAVNFSAEANRDKVREMLSKFQKVGQQYLGGMLILIVILGALNSLGLYLIGIDYPLFFGYMAALLAVVPYVGTIVGGLLPTLYALVTYDSLWYPAGVVAVFATVQFLEGNILNPRIVGGSLKLNALTSLLALIGGGLLWGISGMILSLPMIAIFRVFCQYFENLQPLAEMLGETDDPQEQDSKVLRWLKQKWSSFRG